MCQKAALIVTCLMLTSVFAYSQDVSNAPIQNDSIAYVPMPPLPPTPLYIFMKVEGGSTSEDVLLTHIAHDEEKFWDYNSRGRVNLVARTYVPITGGIIGKQHKLLELIPGEHSHVPVIGNGVSAHHEAGHEFGLGHANLRIWKTQTEIGLSRKEVDPYDPMTSFPGVRFLNAPHIHYLKWFTGTEEAYAEDGGEYVLNVYYDPKKADFTTLKSLYYEVPGSTRQYWFTYHGLDAKSGDPILAIHSTEDGGYVTYYEGKIAPGVTNIRTGLIFELSKATATTVQVNITLDPTWVLEGD